MLKKRYNKFNAKPVITKTQRFDSTAEFQYKQHLDYLKKNNKVRFYLTQIPFHLLGGTKLIIDFLVFYMDGTCQFIDVKGRETPIFKLKKKEVEAIYPIEIVKIRKKKCKNGYDWERYN